MYAKVILAVRAFHLKYLCLLCIASVPTLSVFSLSRIRCRREKEEAVLLYFSSAGSKSKSKILGQLVYLNKKNSAHTVARHCESTGVGLKWSLVCLVDCRS